MDLKVELDYVETQESRYRKNAAIQIRQEVENVLKHARLSTEEESAAPALQLRKNRKRGSSRQNIRCQVRGKQRQTVKRSLSRKSHLKRKATGREISGVDSARDSNPDVIYGRDFEESLFHWKRLPGDG